MNKITVDYVWTDISSRRGEQRCSVEVVHSKNSVETSVWQR